MPIDTAFISPSAVSGDPENPHEGSPFVIGLLLRQAHDHFAEAMDRALAPFGFERRHLMVLMRIDASGPLSQRDLVAQTDHDKASIVRIVDDLERLGLVSRELVPGDRRLRAVTMTDRGRDVFAQAHEAAEPAAAAATAALSPAQTRQLQDLLRTMAGS